MWKDWEKPCGSKKNLATGVVEEIGAFSTGGKIIHISPLTFHIGMWKKEGGQSRSLLVPGVDICGDILNDLCLFRVGLDQPLNAVEGAEDGTVVPVELMTDFL